MALHGGRTDHSPRMHGTKANALVLEKARRDMLRRALEDSEARVKEIEHFIETDKQKMTNSESPDGQK